MLNANSPDWAKIFSEKRLVWGLFIFSMVLWFLTFVKNLAGAPAMTRHGLDYYLIIKYHLDSLQRGVFPLWDPYGAWGRPDEVDARFIGPYNPFLWVYFLFTALQVWRPIAFLLYAFLYYQAGVIGFYFLANRILKDRWLALLSAVLLMFSSQTFLIFNNYCVNLIFIPVVWFFYYLIAFGQEPRRHFFLGLIFSTALIVTTYMPFYFLTVLQPFAIGMIIFYWRVTTGFFKKTVTFLKDNRWFASLCVIFLIFALLPGILWYLDSFSGNYILSWRHEGSADQHTASMALRTIQSGSIGNVLTLPALFQPENDLQYLFVFISIFFALILLLSVVNRVNKRQILLVLIFVGTFLISIGNLTPVHGFLYQHFYFYRLFRNLLYLIYFLIPVFILFGAEQMRGLLSFRPDRWQQRLGCILFVWTAHALFAAFLRHEGGDRTASYITVGVSLAFFTLYYLGFLTNRRNLSGAILVILAIIQPLVFFSYYSRHFSDIAPWLTTRQLIPRFSYLRPSSKNEDYFKGKNETQNMDSSGFIAWKYFGMKWAYDLQKNINPDILENYTRYKFAVYDRVVPMDPRHVDFARLEKAFASKENRAIVYASDQASTASAGDTQSSEMRFILEGDPSLKVSQFDLNHIRLMTVFNAPKFLVYNDAFHSDWKAAVNGKPVKIYQANGAFKGIWLPAGKADVVFRYGPWWKYGLNFALMGLFTIAGAWLLRLSLQAYSQRMPTRQGMTS